jgi:hypothetical protein
MLLEIINLRSLHTQKSFTNVPEFSLSIICHCGGHDCRTVSLQFTLFEVTWQQASKHISKSIICGTVSMLRSECLVVSGEKGAKGKFWCSWSKSFRFWNCFNWPKATFHNEILITFSGLHRGRKMAIYLQKLVIFFPLSKSTFSFPGLLMFVSISYFVITISIFICCDKFHFTDNFKTISYISC